MRLFKLLKFGHILTHPNSNKSIILDMWMMRRETALLLVLVLVGLLHGAEAALEDSEVTQVIDYSDLVVFDAFNSSYLSSLDFKGLLLPPDKEPGISELQGWEFTLWFLCELLF